MSNSTNPASEKLDRFADIAALKEARKESKVEEEKKPQKPSTKKPTKKKEEGSESVSDIFGVEAPQKEKAKPTHQIRIDLDVFEYFEKLTDKPGRMINEILTKWIDYKKQNK